MPLLLKNEEMWGILSMEQNIKDMEVAYKEFGEGKAAITPRARIYIPSGQKDVDYWFNNIGGAVPGFKAMALRIDSSLSRDIVVQDVRRNEYPGDFVGLVLLFSTETCELLAIMDDHYLSVIRVGATSGVGAKCLAREDARVVGIFGSGEQARTQLMAMRAVRNVSLTKVYSPNKDHREKYAGEMSKMLEIEVKPVATPKEVVESSDIVIEATNASQPVLDGHWLKEGTHIASIVGGDWHMRRGLLDDETIKRSDLIYVNSRQQVFLDKQVDLYDRLQRKMIQESQIHELGELLVEKAPGRTDPRQITLHKNNCGMGIQFAVTAMRIYELAKQKGIGREIPREWFITARGEGIYSP